MAPKPRPAIDRLMERRIVDPATGCWMYSKAATSMADRYPWIMQNLPGVDPPGPGLRPREVACPTCDYVLRRGRKKCPACFTRLEQLAETA